MSCSIDEDSADLPIEFDVLPLPIGSKSQNWNGREVQSISPRPTIVIPSVPDGKNLSAFYQRNFIDLTFADLDDEEEEIEFPEEEWVLAQAMAFIERNYREELTVEELLALRGLMFDCEQGENTICKSILKRMEHGIKKACHETKKGFKKAAKKAKKTAKKVIDGAKDVGKEVVHFVKDVTKGAVNVVKETVKAVGNGLNDLSEELCHAAKEVHQWCKEHPKVTKTVKIIAIAAAVVTAVVLLYPVIAAAAAVATEAIALGYTLVMTAVADVIDKIANRSPKSKEEESEETDDGLDVQNAPEETPFKSPFKTYLEDRQLSAIDPEHVPQNNPYLPMPDAPELNYAKVLPERSTSSKEETPTSNIWSNIFSKMRQGLEIIGNGLSESEFPAPITTDQNIRRVSNEETRAEPKNAFSNFLEMLRQGFQTIGEGMTETELREPNTPLDLFHKNYADLQSGTDPLKDKTDDSDTSAKISGFEEIMQKFLGVFKPEGNKASREISFELLLKNEQTFLQTVLDPASFSHAPATNEPETSRIYKTDGQERDDIRITFGNGINNTFEFAKGNAEHIRSLCPIDICIHGVYSKTNSAIIDAAEVALLNFVGYSPKTPALQRADWEEFHYKNLHRPNAKIMHICHSKGGLDTINTLQSLPKEIQNRIIVISIGSADHVPAELCFRSINYASDKDFVPFVQVLLHSLYASALGEKMQENYLNNIWENYNKTIFLKADKDSSFFDHEFISKTYIPVLQLHLEDYIARNGEYE